MSTRSVFVSRSTWTSLFAAPAALVRAWQRRRMVGRLGALDDHLLADIGITRQDVLSVLAEPLFVDPSEKLAERAAEMRRGSRAMRRDAYRAELGRAPTAPDYDGRHAA